MTTLEWTDIQMRRLKELSATGEELATTFETPADRNQAYQKLEKRLVTAERAKLRELLATGLRPRILKLQRKLVEALNAEGFTQVTTPTVISRAFLARLSIDHNHPLSEQVFWIDGKQCLRPMLAPNLYSLMYDLGRLKERPIRFFEIGSCFRKESSGAKHNQEFTMLNLVEMGLPKEERADRLKELGTLVAETAGITDYRFESEESEVYGDTVAVVHAPTDTELASGAMGPHPLDAAWKVDDTWVGLGFGLERLLMTAEGSDTIGRWGRSIAYLDGIRLNI